MTWYSVFNDIFWLSLGGILIGFGGVIINACIKSKCSELNFCFGLFKCVRDVKAEVDLEEHRIDARLPPDTPVATRV